MSLLPGEPAAGRWRVAQLEELAHLVLEAAGTPRGRPRIVAVDGRGGSGKSTIAARLNHVVPASAVVSTDDIAWQHSFFDWVDLLVGGVLQPLHSGDGVSYRPPAWDEHDRSGAVDVPAGLDLVLVEGVGAGRRELMHWMDAVVWVQSDVHEAERRAIARDIAQGVNGDEAQATAFWHEWMAEELPFVSEQRPWERAAVVVRGTSTNPQAPGQVVLAPPPGAGTT